MGLFAQMTDTLSAGRSENQTIVINATSLKEHRTAASLDAKKGGTV